MKKVFVIQLTSINGRVEDYIKGEGLIIRRWNSEQEALNYLKKTFNRKYLYKIFEFIEFDN